ncbi:YetF domain-containing protein [Proteus mirabilis]|uniref:YetF domain-containing protein n=1 Tax=Proteus mirabilis TaxID=584 RepID=UPI001E2ABB64|nr:YetF domain-containing protein [Proteus mirabilis]MCD4610438.1 DUF421 domain-containing protein [Proteus mirabilis]
MNDGNNDLNFAAYLQNKQKSLWMFDCGEATQHQILHSHVKLSRINKIFITHLHGDHIFGLPGLLCSRSMGGTENPLTIYGPTGIKAFIETALTLSQSYLTYPLDIIEIEQDGFLFEEEGIRVSCGALSHPVPCFGYRLEEDNKPGKLNADKLEAENIPRGPWYKLLKQGKTVTLPDGQITVVCDGAKMPSIIIMKDGVIRTSELEQIERDENWLNEEMKKQHIDNPEDVFLAEFWDGKVNFILQDGKIKHDFIPTAE